MVLNAAEKCAKTRGITLVGDSGNLSGRYVVSRLRKGLAFGALLAVVVAGGPGVTAFGASAPAPSPSPRKALRSPSPAKAQSIAAAQSGAASARQRLGLGGGEKLVVKDVIADADGSTHVRYDRTFDGLRVIGADFVSHRDKSGKIKGVSWNGAHKVAVSCTNEAFRVPAALAKARLVFGFVEATATLWAPFQLTPLILPDLSRWLTKSAPMTRRPWKVRS